MSNAAVLEKDVTRGEGQQTSALRDKRSGLLLGLPPVTWLTVFLFAPYVYLLLMSFWQVNPANPYLPVLQNWNVDNYVKLAQESGYLKVLLRSVGFGLAATAIATVLGYLVAYYLAFMVERYRTLLYMLVILPLWASYLVRAYAWKVILGDNGVISGALQYLGLTDHPEGLLYSGTAVIITLAHVYTPFMIMTIFTTLDRIPPSLHEASYDLGVSRFTTFRRVTLPLSLPGVLAGAFFTVGLATGEFVAPSLVGGANDVMIAQLIQQQFGAVNNKPFAAAISVAMVCIVMTIIYLSGRFERREQIDA